MSNMQQLTSGAALAALRRRCDLTQDDLAEAGGCSKQYISKLENGGSRTCSEAIADGIKTALLQALQEAVHAVTDALFVPIDFPSGKVLLTGEES